MAETRGGGRLGKAKQRGETAEVGNRQGVKTAAAAMDVDAVVAM